MTETNETYDLVPVTAAEKWWEDPPDRFEFDGNPVLHVWHSCDDTTFPILVVYQLATEHREGSAEWVTVDGIRVCEDERITRRVPKQLGWRYFRDGIDRAQVSASNRDAIKRYIETGWIETDAQGNPLHTVDKATKEVGVTWRYFRGKESPCERRRAASCASETKHYDFHKRQWVRDIDGVYCNAEGYAGLPAWIETDAHGNPLATTPPPTRQRSHLARVIERLVQEVGGTISPQAFTDIDLNAAMDEADRHAASREVTE